MYFYEIVHSGGVAMLKAWSKTMGILALSSGESELAGQVWKYNQLILGDFDLCGHVAVKSDAIAAIGTVHRLG